jgi:hypothetical protein
MFHYSLHDAFISGKVDLAAIRTRRTVTSSAILHEDREYVSPKTNVRIIGAVRACGEKYAHCDDRDQKDRALFHGNVKVDQVRFLKNDLC